MGCTLIRSPPFEGGDGRLASVPTDNGTNAFALDGQGGGSVTVRDAGLSAARSPVVLGPRLLRVAGQRRAAVRSGRESRSCEAGVPRRVGSQAEGGRKKSLRNELTLTVNRICEEGCYLLYVALVGGWGSQPHLPNFSG